MARGLGRVVGNQPIDHLVDLLDAEFLGCGVAHEASWSQEGAKPATSLNGRIIRRTSNAGRV